MNILKNTFQAGRHKVAFYLDIKSIHLQVDNRLRNKVETLCYNFLRNIFGRAIIYFTEDIKVNDCGKMLFKPVQVIQSAGDISDSYVLNKIAVFYRRIKKLLGPDMLTLSIKDIPESI